MGNWTLNKVYDFVNWHLKVIGQHDRHELENQTLVDSFEAGDTPEMWYTPERESKLERRSFSHAYEVTEFVNDYDKTVVSITYSDHIGYTLFYTE